MLLALVPFGGSAQNLQQDSQYYLSVFTDRQVLRVSENATPIRPIVVSASAGYWVRPGIGLELEAGFGIVDDSIGTLEVDTSSQLAASLRLESKPQGNFAAYALFSYVRSTYDASVDGLNSSLSFPGARLGIGLTYTVTPHWRADVGFTHHDYDGDTRVNSFRFGLRYDLGI